MSLGRRYANLVVRLRWFVLLGWLAIALAAFVYLPHIGQSGGGGLGGFVDADNPAVQAEIRSFQKFLVSLSSRIAVVSGTRTGSPPWPSCGS